MTARRHGPSAQARRDALLRATLEIVAERGVAAVTHRAVTERAGLPLATVSYFFSSIHELEAEALRVFMADECATQTAAAEHLASQQLTADEVGRELTAATAPRYPETPAFMESLLHAARSEEFRDAVRDALAGSRAVAAAALQAVGTPNPEAVAPALTALAHGLALNQLAVPGDIDEETSYQAFRALVLGYLLQSGHRDLALSLIDAESE
ncbi:TetR family transcriptional regulator C-terminal domain-containing protein [Hoyosella sp. YIM 151337]|uniref:TetR/AcrR family transcriptional regulator n=1 Tax=Hoyosella sp. YIM 151337 TaxID=2992742 RepID=UPI0022363466|nr:TetR family transcriptional regulator C-terminal domain-containing protein [Hoyosella sp. YIM 151337]MCW4352219.1 TetR family transcriptional regulator C-terminal domain-containing protein [Hoyosella sp. YIM 151337]